MGERGSAVFRTGTWNGCGWLDTGLTWELAQGPSRLRAADLLRAYPELCSGLECCNILSKLFLSVSRKVPLPWVEMGVLAVHACGLSAPCCSGHLLTPDELWGRSPALASLGLV